MWELLQTDDASARGGIGLRAQIVLALLSGLAISLVLLGIALDRLTTAALEREREHAAGVMARAVAATLGRADAPPFVLDRVEADFVRADGIVGIEIIGAGRIERLGLPGIGALGEAPIAGGTVRVYLSRHPGADEATASPVRLMVFYAVATSAGMLLLVYVLLTRLIVRPVESLTVAAERLARGGSGGAPATGAAEVQRLAVAFARMSDDLAREREAREARLAELERTTAALRATQDSLVRSEKLASVGRLAAGVAHEIGNPLAAILGLIQLLREGGLGESEQTEFLRRIHGETERIQRIIRDLLDFARREPAPEGASALHEIVDGAVALVAPQKDLRRVTIERAVPSELPKVRGEPDALTQLVLNLLINAADAIEGSGTITIEARHEGQLVVLTVSDTGPGIADSVRATLFEPFVTTKPAGRGTGLGLAVCWTIVERIGGTIEAENRPEGGARFRVEIPTAD